jgi:hypothetical protein
MLGGRDATVEEDKPDVIEELQKVKDRLDEILDNLEERAGGCCNGSVADPSCPGGISGKRCT